MFLHSPLRGLPNAPAVGWGEAMLKLPDVLIPHEEQHQLAALAALITPAQEMLRISPFNEQLWKLLLIGLHAERHLWHANLRLVMRIAYEVAQRRGHDVDDLFQEGCLALRDAIRRYDPSLGARVTSFAHELITRRLWGLELPGTWVGSTTHYRRLRMAMEGGAQLTSAQTTMALAQQVSQEALHNLACPNDDYELVDEQGVEVLALLEPRLQQVLRMRFGFDGPEMSQDEIARYFGVSGSTISRWEHQAISQARKMVTQDATTVTEATRLSVTVDEFGISARSPRRRRRRSSSEPPSPSRIPHRLAS